MGKTLTVSIAAYNDEKYIRRALDSLIDEDIIDDLEIFVIDDGGTDGTLGIAQEYADKYPDSIFPVHKENEGYGSTVNYSIAHATGKYFKLLDGDDWFDQRDLIDYIYLLKQVDTDVIVTSYFKYENGISFEKVGMDKNYAKDADILISQLKVSQVFGMWALTFKTDILRDSGINLPEHCLYTDMIYSTVPFAFAKNIRFVDYSVYCYNIGEEEQSTSKKSRLAHIDDNIEITDYLCRFYESNKSKNNDNGKYILRRVSVYSKNMYRTFLMEPVSQQMMDQIEEYDRKLKTLSYDVYKGMTNIVVHKKIALFIFMLRLVNYGRIGLQICKLVIPEDGMDNW